MDNFRVQIAAGKLVPFQQNKLFLSLYNACAHREQAIADATSLTDTIIAQLGPKATNGIIRAADIVKIALQTLKNFDTAASVQYRAFHPVKDV